MPVGGKPGINELDDYAGFFQQDLVDQERHQQGHRNADNGRKNGDKMRVYQYFFML